MQSKVVRLDYNASPMSQTLGMWEVSKALVDEFTQEELASGRIVQQRANLAPVRENRVAVKLPQAQRRVLSRSSSMQPRMRLRTPASKGSHRSSPKKRVPSADSAVAFMLSVFMA